jgi:preprotein translocase subunit SecD
MTRYAAIPLFGVGLTLGAFGLIRGTTPAGPRAGVRLVLSIAPPVDDDARDMAVHVAKARVEEKGSETRVVAAGDHVVVELGETDPSIVGDATQLVKRTAKLELHVVMPNDSWRGADYVKSDDHAKELGIRIVDGALVADDRRTEDHRVVPGDQVLATYLAAIPALGMPHGHTLAYGRMDEPPVGGAVKDGDERAWRTFVLDDAVLVAGSEIRRVEVGDGGVVADLNPEAARRVAAQASTRTGAPIAVVLDGKVKAVAPLPAATPEPTLHLRPTGAGTTGAPAPTEDAAIRRAIDLQDVLEAGAVHSLDLVASTPFTRAVGFLPRAWPFLALALLSLAVGVFLWRRRV